MNNGSRVRSVSFIAHREVFPQHLEEIIVLCGLESIFHQQVKSSAVTSEYKLHFCKPCGVGHIIDKCSIHVSLCHLWSFRSRTGRQERIHYHT